MPCYTRMKTIYLRGLLWLYLLGLGYVVSSLEPGFLDFDNLPDTNFSCVGKVIGGYYADLETNCQMFHVCTIGQLDEPMDIRFLCLNGTVFDQETRVCERIDEVDCSKSEQFYSLNLELYGNTQPSVLEENAETAPPIIIKASTTSTTTTTTQKPKSKTTKAAFFTTSPPKVTTVTRVISTHHFPISSRPDIRFNPEEINISLNPSAPPNIRPKSVAYQQQVFSNSNDNKKIVVTTHTSYGSPEKEDLLRVVPNTPRPQVSSTQKSKVQSPATPVDINYGFTYHQTENSNTEPPHPYQYHHYNRHGQFRNQFKTTTYRTEDHIPTTRKHTTFRTSYVPSYSRTDKPQRLQLPLPLLPTLPPLTFSSPAPFSLGHHIEAKRYTSDQTPPRIIISASASVSDASGRRLNYSLGTIGVTPLLEEPPKTYDEYKDHDVVLDPFYHDVPKIKARRRKRQVKLPEVSEQAAVDVLKFLFDWYKNHENSTTAKVPTNAEDIIQISDQLAPIIEASVIDKSDTNFRDSALFTRKSKFNIVGDILSVTEKEQETVTEVKPVLITTPKAEAEDYVDDNYEAVLHEEKLKQAVTTEKELTTTLIDETTPEPTITTTTTTAEPTTTSRLMGILRQRAIAHQKRVYDENRKRYNMFLSNVKPKIRTLGKRTTSTDSTITIDAATEKLELTTTSLPKIEELIQEAAVPDNVRSHSEERMSIVEVLHNEPEGTTLKEESQIVEASEDKSPSLEEEVLSETAEIPLGVNDKLDNEEVTETSFEESPLVKVEDNSESLEEREFGEISNPVKNLEYLEELSPVEVKESSMPSKESEITETSNPITSLDEEYEEYEDMANLETSTTAELLDGNIPTTTETIEHVESTIQEDEATKEIEENIEITTYPEEIYTVTEEPPNNETSTKLTENVEPHHETATKLTENVEPHHETSTKLTENVESPRKGPKSRRRGGGRSRFKKKNIAEHIELQTKKKATSEGPKNEKDEKTIEKEVQQQTSENENSLIEQTKDASSIPKVKIGTRGRARGRNKFQKYDNTEQQLGRRSKFQKYNNTQQHLERNLQTDEVSEEPKNEETTSVILNVNEGTVEPDENTTTEYVMEITEDTKGNLDETITTTGTGEEVTQFSSTEPNTESLTVQSQEESTTTAQLYQTITTESAFAKLNTETETVSSLYSDEETSTNLTPAETTTTEIPRRKTRPSRARISSSYRKPNPRHRFSSEYTTRPTRRKPIIEEEIIDAVTSQITTTESLTRSESSTSPKIIDYSEDVPATETPLFKSANPTQAESTKESLHTTPLSMVYKLHVRKEKLKSYIFNCFDKAINKFYSDPRDCRLFHYCTSGYTKNQLLDMKFVCDLGTYFDEEKLICTKTKPKRCL